METVKGEISNLYQNESSLICPYKYRILAARVSDTQSDEPPPPGTHHPPPSGFALWIWVISMAHCQTNTLSIFSMYSLHSPCIPVVTSRLRAEP